MLEEHRAKLVFGVVTTSRFHSQHLLSDNHLLRFWLHRLNFRSYPTAEVGPLTSGQTTDCGLGCTSTSFLQSSHATIRRYMNNAPFGLTGHRSISRIALKRQVMNEYRRSAVQYRLVAENLHEYGDGVDGTLLRF